MVLHINNKIPRLGSILYGMSQYSYRKISLGICHFVSQLSSYAAREPYILLRALLRMFPLYFPLVLARADALSSQQEQKKNKIAQKICCNIIREFYSDHK